MPLVFLLPKRRIYFFFIFTAISIVQLFVTLKAHAQLQHNSNIDTAIYYVTALPISLGFTLDRLILGSVLNNLSIGSYVASLIGLSVIIITGIAVYLHSKKALNLSTNLALFKTFGALSLVVAITLPFVQFYLIPAHINMVKAAFQMPTDVFYANEKLQYFVCGTMLVVILAVNLKLILSKNLFHITLVALLFGSLINAAGLIQASTSASVTARLNLFSEMRFAQDYWGCFPITPFPRGNVGQIDAGFIVGGCKHANLRASYQADGFSRVDENVVKNTTNSSFWAFLMILDDAEYRRSHQIEPKHNAECLPFKNVKYKEGNVLDRFSYASGVVTSHIPPDTLSSQIAHCLGYTDLEPNHINMIITFPTHR